MQGDRTVPAAGAGWVEFDEDVPAGREQPGALAQQPQRVTADADVPVDQQHVSPGGLVGDGEYVRAAGGYAAGVGQGDSLRADVNAQRGPALAGEGGGQAAGSAADVEGGAGAAGQ